MARLKRNLTIWTIAAHLLHHCSTFKTPLQHIYSTIAAHLQHHCSTFTAPLQHIYITIAAHLLHHCSTFTALLLSTKFRLILEEEKFQFLNWCYLFEGLIENGKVKKELNKTWHKLFWSFCHKLYISNTDKTFWCCNMQHNFSTVYFYHHHHSETWE